MSVWDVRGRVITDLAKLIVGGLVATFVVLANLMLLWLVARGVLGGDFSF